MGSDSDSDSGGGFGWGLFVGSLLGIAAGAYLASGPGRQQVDGLRSRTIELTGGGDQIRARAKTAADKARVAVSDPGHPMRKAINDGISAARRRRQELEFEGGNGVGEGGTVLDPGRPEVG